MRSPFCTRSHSVLNELGQIGSAGWRFRSVDDLPRINSDSLLAVPSTRRFDSIPTLLSLMFIMSIYRWLRSPTNVIAVYQRALLILISGKRCLVILAAVETLPIETASASNR
jgi:hypothetical protein